MMDTLTGETSGDTNYDQQNTAREMVEHVVQVKWKFFVKNCDKLKIF